MVNAKSCRSTFTIDAASALSTGSSTGLETGFSSPAPTTQSGKSTSTVDPQGPEPGLAKAYCNLIRPVEQRKIRRPFGDTHAATVAAPAQDVLARYGGEEFVVMLPHIDLVAAARVGHHIPVAVCVGVAALMGDADEIGPQARW